MFCGVRQARTGRDRQRYEDDFRLVSGCIPYKLEENVEGHGFDLLSRLRVLMISTPNRQDLVFPKGGWEDDESEEDAAHREAEEEAGVKGTIRGTLGVWTFRSKTKDKPSCKGKMFVMEVTEELNAWAEQTQYGRKWLTVEEAHECCRYDWMREALDKCVGFLSAEVSLELDHIPETSTPENENPMSESIPITSSVLFKQDQHSEKLTCPSEITNFVPYCCLNPSTSSAMILM